jgi:hypothetical protein
MAIVSPADGSVVSTLPTMLQVSFTNGADPAAMKALLDGVDVTAQFAPADANGVRQMQVSRPAVNIGKNQLQVTDGMLTARASFTVSLNSPGAPGATATLPLLVPIQTRYMTGDGTHNGDYSIALFADPNNPTTPTNVYHAPDATPGNQGLQVLFLRRSDLGMVQNTVVPSAVPPGGDGNYTKSLLFEILTYAPPAGCGTGGCLLILQSLGTLGYTPCSVPGYPRDCIGLSVLFQQMGSSARWLYGNGVVPQIAYSFIGNTFPNGAGLNNEQAGVYFERLTCSVSNNADNPRLCDSLGTYPSRVGFPSTSNTAPSNATPGQIGNISGALVRDNFFNYTFAQTAPPVYFSSHTDTTNTIHAFTIDENTYSSGSTNNPVGGFHLVILDRTTLALKENQWWSAVGGSTSALQRMQSFLESSQFNTYGNLIFIAAFGDTRYPVSPAQTGTANRKAWGNFAASDIQALGGTAQVFYLLNNEEHAPPFQVDDYTFAGAWVDKAITGLSGVHYKEMSSVISRETEAFPLSSDMEGMLTMDHQGYYSPGPTGHNLGAASIAVTDAVGASLHFPLTPWPFPGPDVGKSQAAYTWISEQLCCEDIRSAYVNQNVSPQLWLNALAQLNFDMSKLPASDLDNFDAMKEQLATEFQYLAAVRQLQTNVLSLYQEQQSNVPLLLQAAQNEVTQNLQVALNTPAHSASWLKILSDALGAVGLIAPFTGVKGLGTAISFATFATNQAAEHTNTPAGSSLAAQEKLEVQAGQLASTAASEYAQNLVTLGNEFDRIVTDWGRLRAIGSPLLSNLLPWDSNAAGYLLQAYDRTILREFYTKLMETNTEVIYYPYITDQSFIGDTEYGSGYECMYEENGGGIDPYWQQGTLPILLYPTVVKNNDTGNGRCCDYPHDYQWGVWALVFQQNYTDDCPMSHTQPATFNLFTPWTRTIPTVLGPTATGSITGTSSCHKRTTIRLRVTTTAVEYSNCQAWCSFNHPLVGRVSLRLETGFTEV